MGRGKRLTVLHSVATVYANCKLSRYIKIMLCIIHFHIYQNFDSSCFGGRRKKEKYDWDGVLVISIFSEYFHTFINKR